MLVSPVNVVRPRCVEDDIGRLLRRVVTSILRQTDKRLESRGLTSAQWPTLSKIQDGRCTTVAYLARETGTDPGAMTRILDRLEAKGLCKRIRSSDDRRVVNLELTTKGEDALSGAQLTLAEVIDSHLAGFSREERQVLHGNLQRMLENGVALRDVGGDLPEQ